MMSPSMFNPHPMELVMTLVNVPPDSIRLLAMAVREEGPKSPMLRNQCRQAIQGTRLGDYVARELRFLGPGCEAIPETDYDDVARYSRGVD
jgi:hypothetical protein